MKSSTPGEIQLTFGHSTVRNKSLGETLQAFALSGNLSSPSVIAFNLEIAFAPEEEKIRLLIMEGLLRAAAGDLKGTKKATGLAVPQRRPSSALPDRGLHSPWRIRRRRTPEGLRPGNH